LALAIFDGKVEAFKKLAQEAINIAPDKSKVLGYPPNRNEHL